MPRSAIHEQHVNLNAEFLQGNEWEIPANYGSVEREVETVRNTGGFADLSSRGKLLLKGKEHLKLLQGMLSNDVMLLEVGQGTYATLLTVKGKVMSDMRVYRSEDTAIMDLEPGINKVIRDHLVKYKLSYRAEIEDISYDYSLFHICGPAAADLLEKLFNIETANINEPGFIKVESENYSFFLFKVNRTGETGFDIMVGNEYASELWNRIFEEGKNDGLVPFGMDALEILRVEAGIPLYGKDFDDSTIPIEAGLWHALSFEKGCYIGQEVVARIKWRGRVNWHLVGILAEEGKIPEKDDPVYCGEKKIGRITSAVYSYSINKPVALGYVRREFVEPGTAVNILSGETVIAATVTATPFYNH